MRFPLARAKLTGGGHVARRADGDGRLGSFRGRATTVSGGTRRGCVPGAAAGLAWEEAFSKCRIYSRGTAQPPIIGQNLYAASHFAVYSALCLRLSAQEHLSASSH